MKLFAVLVDVTRGDGAFLHDQFSSPDWQDDPFSAPTLQWLRNASLDDHPRYRARLNSPHPRTLRIPTTIEGNYAYLLVPHVPKTTLYRLFLGNGNYTPTGTFGLYLSKGAAYIPIQEDIPCPSNAYTLYDFDPTTSGEPSLMKLRLNTGNGTTHEIGDVKLLAGIDLDPLLDRLVPTETGYDLALFTPLAENALMGRILRARTYEIDLLVSRDDPAYPFLLRLRDYDQLYLEHDGRYLPVALDNYNQTSVGGMLQAVQLRLAATAAYALNPIRYIKSDAYAAGDIISYNLPGDAPAPVEIRIRITERSSTYLPIIHIHMPAAGEKVMFRPDAVGVWSLHDTGRIYHCRDEEPASIVDRTDTLRIGTLPLLAPPGDGHYVLEVSNATVSDTALAAYPRYQPESLL